MAWREPATASAKAAGMVCVVTKSSYAAREDFSNAGRVVRNLDANGGVDLDALRALFEGGCV